MKNKIGIRKIYDGLRNLLLNRAVALLFVILTVSASQTFASFAYVSSDFNGITVINTDTNMTVTTIFDPSFNVPAGVAITPDGQYVYVANNGGTTVSVISTSTNTVVAVIPGFNGPSWIAITPDGQYAYVTNAGLIAGEIGTVSIIQISTNTIVGPPIVLTGALDPGGISITPNGQYAFIPNSTSDNVSVIQLSTNTFVTNIQFPVGSFPSYITISPNGATAYVTNGTANNVVLINTTAPFAIEATIGLPASPAVIAITPDGSTAYIASLGSDSYSVMNLSTNAVTNYPLPDIGSIGVAITPNGKDAYLVDSSANIVYEISTSTNMIVDSFATIMSPTYIAITPLGSPVNLKGKQEKNDFGTVYEWFNHLKWQPSPALTTVGYYVYRDGVRIATLKPSAVSYEDHDRIKGVGATYSVTAFNAQGDESFPGTITIN